MGDKPGDGGEIMPTASDGTTSIYAIRIAMDGVHGVSPDGNDLISVFSPDMNAPGAVKMGEVELVAAIAIKKTKSLAALRNIKVTAAEEAGDD
jgi:hypothetical protein